MDSQISNPAVPLGAASLGAIRSTTPRTDAKVDPARQFTAVAQVIRETGLLRRARWFYITLMTGLGLALAAAGAGFVLLGDSWLQLLIAAALGILFTQFAFFSHEAAHRQVLASGPANDRIGRLVGNLLVGMSYSWWMNKHTRHHANPNQVGKDPDIAGDIIAFTDDKATNARGLMAIINKRQGWLFFPLLTLEGLNLYVQSYQWLLTRRGVKGRVFELILLTIRFAIVFGAAFWFLPLGMAFAFLGVQIAVFGLYMGAAFAPNHIGMPIIARDAKLDFFTKQVLTSRNIRGGFFASAIYGGLNYQVEHHLFPNMARVHLAKTRRIVREHCRTLDIPYTETSIPRAYADVIEYLTRVGRFARDPFTCPVVGRYRRT
ncbi:fatty acid desaturase family protein [Pseudolysinimonas yzui]|uniref:Fatty acid desaturase n=1 Tax=Pseudolysinimonas yzui TaxID=2708254 RepID=A0A8J3GT15_9MICO|nr:acyl-CoA desaturase [Pseudolysinimonas yzui]GHF24417.1 fatty acid desaturase [Pseudolysinimonas yzui]